MAEISSISTDLTPRTAPHYVTTEEALRAERKRIADELRVIAREGGNRDRDSGVSARLHRFADWLEATK